MMTVMIMTNDDDYKEGEDQLYVYSASCLPPPKIPCKKKPWSVFFIFEEQIEKNLRTINIYLCLCQNTELRAAEVASCVLHGKDPAGEGCRCL